MCPGKSTEMVNSGYCPCDDPSGNKQYVTE